jgi:hypothetical protein
MAASYAIGNSPQPPYCSSFLNGFITVSIIEAPPQPPFITRRRVQVLACLRLLHLRFEQDRLQVLHPRLVQPRFV